MKKQTIIIVLLLASILACSTGESTLEPSTSSTQVPLTEMPPTSTPESELADIVITIDAELTQDTCAGYDPIVGGNVTVNMTTEDGNLDGIGKVEFFIEEELIHTASELPYGFEDDTSIYDDGTELTLRVDVYDRADTLHQSESMILRVDNTTDPTLRSLGEAAGIEMANIVMGDSSYQVPFADKLYFETLCQNFNLIIVDYGMYMSVMQATQSRVNYSMSDQVVEFSETNGMKMRGHPLIWGVNLDWDDPETDWTATPKWVHDGDFSREEMIDIMYERIEGVMTHYQGQINEWVVVNESFGGFNGEQGIALKNNVWTQKLGDDYVELAFKYARQVDPDAVLILNEVNVDYLGQEDRVEGFYLFVVDLLQKETPIDIVGFQFHWIVGQHNPTVEDIVDNFARYGELGLEVSISEMDVRIEEPVTPEELEEQARLYAIAMQACLESEYCTSFSVWSHSDKYSWIPSSFSGFGAAHLFDENMQPKPAYDALIEVMQTYLDQIK